MKLPLIITLFLAFLFQIFLLPLYQIGPAGPDFVLLLLLYVARHDRLRRSLPLALFSGLLADALSMDPWGAHAAAYAGAVLFLGQWARDGWRGEPGARIVTAAAGALVAGALRLGVLSLVKDSRPLFEITALASCALYNGFLSLIVFGLLDPFRSRLFVVPARLLTVTSS